MLINKKVVLLCIGLYALCWAAIVTADLYFWLSGDNKGDFYYYCFINMSGTNGLLNLLYTHRLMSSFVLKNHQVMFPIIIWGIPCVLPSLICLVCCVIQILSLWSRRQVRSADTVNRRVTVTILLLTLIFISCNTLNFTFCIVMVVLRWEGVAVYLGLYIATSCLPFINTLLNPVVLILRGQRLRSFVVGFLSVQRERLRTNGSIRLGGAGGYTRQGSKVPVTVVDEQGNTMVRLKNGANHGQSC